MGRGSLLKSKEKYNYKSFVEKKEIYEEFLYRMESLTACDYSARQKMSKLYELFFRILNDWGSYIAKQPIKSTNNVHKEWTKHRKAKIKKILKTTNSAITKKNDFTSKLEFYEIEEQLKDGFRDLSPVYYAKGKYSFSVEEFGSRFLESTIATK